MKGGMISKEQKDYLRLAAKQMDQLQAENASLREMLWIRYGQMYRVWKGTDPPKKTTDGEWIIDIGECIFSSAELAVEDRNEREK